MPVAYDVIVVGAGMAGLKAGYDLQQSGKSAVILEARERIGGRIWTDRTFSDVPIELGAELVHGERAETWDLLRSQRIRTVGSNRVGLRSQHGGWRNPLRWFSSWHRLGLSAAPQDDESAAQYLTRMNIDSQDIPFDLRLLEIDSEPLERWSALEVFGGDLESEADDGDYRVIGGYDQLFQKLAASLEIHLSQAVTHIT